MSKSVGIKRAGSVLESAAAKTEAFSNSCGLQEPLIEIAVASTVV